MLQRVPGEEGRRGGEGGGEGGRGGGRRRGQEGREEGTCNEVTKPHNFQ